MVFPFRLSKANEDTRLSLAENSSFTFIKSDETAPIKLLRAAEFFNQHQIHNIDLMKINIKGGEYDLLEHLIESVDIKKIKKYTGSVS